MMKAEVVVMIMMMIDKIMGVCVHTDVARDAGRAPGMVSCSEGLGGPGRGAW